ncbi:MAG: hypothetical protein JHC93_04960, partial [Parachlamydiales bacterium]|nr:hypothetical protein [Parachlamydiales bacterium]
MSSDPLKAYNINVRPDVNATVSYEIGSSFKVVFKDAKHTFTFIGQVVSKDPKNSGMPNVTSMLSAANKNNKDALKDIKDLVDHVWKISGPTQDVMRASSDTLSINRLNHITTKNIHSDKETTHTGNTEEDWQKSFTKIEDLFVKTYSDAEVGSESAAEEHFDVDVEKGKLVQQAKSQPPVEKAIDDSSKLHDKIKELEEKIAKLSTAAEQPVNPDKTVEQLTNVIHLLINRLDESAKNQTESNKEMQKAFQEAVNSLKAQRPAVDPALTQSLNNLTKAVQVLIDQSAKNAPSEETEFLKSSINTTLSMLNGLAHSNSNDMKKAMESLTAMHKDLMQLLAERESKGKGSDPESSYADILNGLNNLNASLKAINQNVSGLRKDTARYNQQVQLKLNAIIRLLKANRGLSNDLKQFMTGLAQGAQKLQDQISDLINKNGSQE